MRVQPALSTFALGVLLTACAGSGVREPGMGDPRCRAAGAQAELGKTIDPAVTEAARAGSGALRARVIKPGEAVTMDADPQRLNIEVDDTGKIRRLRCG
jgi:hypothetical protein